jgi:hypothetical protein
MGYTTPRKYTKEVILEISKKFSNSKQWKDNDIISYKAASRHGFLKEATAHFISISKKTKEPTAEQKKEFIRLFDKGTYLAHISKILGISLRRVDKLKSEYVKSLTGTYRLNEEDLKTFISEGKKVKDICAAVGVPQSKVFSMLKKIKLNTQEQKRAIRRDFLIECKNKKKETLRIIEEKKAKARLVLPFGKSNFNREEK